MATHESKTTRDHKTIRRWAEQRGGKPTTVDGTEDKSGAGILRLDFDAPDEKLKPISWDAFFEKFDESDIEFLYQDKTADGGVSRFHKFVHRGNAHGHGGGDRRH